MRYIGSENGYAEYKMRGGILKIDIEDALKLVGHSVYIGSNGYPKVSKYRLGDRVERYVHQIACPCPPGLEVDHINGDKFDARKANLRVCTHAENSRNIPVRSDSTSGVTGVSWSKERKLWVVQLTVNGKTRNFGRFANLDDAIAVRKTAEAEFHGQFAARPKATR